MTPPRTDGDGLCVVRVASLPIEAEVGAVGYRTQRPWLSAEDNPIVLQAGVAVRFHTSVPSSGTNPDYQLQVQLYEVDSSGARGALAIRLGPRRMDILDSAANPGSVVLGPGTYECVPTIRVLGSQRASGGPVELSAYPRITVRESAGEQRCLIEIPQAAVDAAVARYGSM